MERKKLDYFICLLDMLINASRLKKTPALVHACCNRSNRVSSSRLFPFKNHALIFLLLINLSLPAASQEPVVIRWPLTLNTTGINPITVSSTYFSSGSGLKSFHLDQENGATTGGWNSLNQDQNDYYEFKVTPAKNTNLRFSKLSFEVNLDRVNMRTAVHYSLDDFTSSNIRIGQGVYVSINSASTLSVETNLVVRYPETLSIRVYGWSALSEDAKFSIKNVLFTGATVENTRAMDNVFIVSGNGLRCGTAGTTITLSGSVPGVDYKLFLDDKPISVQEGDGGPLEFDEIYNPGTYTIETEDGEEMNGEVVVYTDIEKPEIISPITGTEDIAIDGTKYTHPDNSWDVTAKDNCEIVSLKYKLTGVTTGEGTSLAGVSFNLGITIVTWTAIDKTGNSHSISYSINVKKEDRTFNISCTSDQTLEITDGCAYKHVGTEWDAIVTGNSVPVSTSYQLSGNTAGSGTSLDDVSFNVGITTVTWDAIDQFGNSSNCSFKVTILDKGNPEITCPTSGTVTVHTTQGCTYVYQGSAWNATAEDNCNTIKSITYELSGATTGSGNTLWNEIFNLGTTTVTWTATDEAGNDSSCSFDVEVVDNSNPVIACPGIGSPIVTTNQGCSYLHGGNGWNATATDNCTLASLTFELTGATTDNGSTLDGVTFNLGKTIVTWTATDVAGNTSTCAYAVTVQDITNPDITCPSTLPSYNTDTDKCTSSQSFTATVTDNCGIQDTKYYINAGEISFPYDFPVGTTTVTVTATDNSNNHSSCAFNVVVVDNQVPVVSCPVPADEYVNDNGKCTTSLSFLATASDNCNIQNIKYFIGTSEITFPYNFEIGTTTVKVVAKDVNTNISECTFEVKVIDKEKPLINCPVVQASYNNESGKCTTTLNIPATATDNCGVPTIKHYIESKEISFPYEFSVGSTTVNAIAFDSHGNQSTCGYTVVVVDNELPTFNCPLPLASYNADNGKCTASLSFPVSPTDNCGVAEIRYTINGSVITLPYDFPVGSSVVFVTVKDNSNNEKVCSFTVNVIDNQLPVITCPTIPATVSTNPGRCGSIQNFTATATDNCGIQSIRYFIGTTQISLPYEFPIGSTKVSVIARDVNGNESTCDYTVNVIDSEKPVITCPTLLASYPNQPGKCSASMTFAATATDNCGTPQIRYSVNGNPITFPYEFPLGSTVVTAIARDNSNNESNPCSFTVTIVDKISPTITCPTVLASYNNDPGQCSRSLSFAATAIDGCGSVQIRYMVGSNIITFPYKFPVGSTTVTAVARDNSGNETPCSFTVNVKDAETPIITAPANVVRSLGLACITNISLDNPVIIEHCTIAKLTWVMTGSTNATSPAAGVNYVPKPYAFNQGITTITYTVEDGSGNTASCSFTVTVNDDTAPVFSSCPSDITIDLAANQCSATITYTAPTATDCNLVTVTRTAGLASGSSFPAGVTTVVHTATDPSGNTSTCSFKVTVKDVTPPVLTCPPPKVLEINAHCNVTLTAAEIGYATATDNCNSPVTITHDIPTNMTFPVGHNYITWTATDASGNSTTCKQLISVTRGIALVNYSYSNYTPRIVNGTLLPSYTASGVTSHQSFSSELLSSGRIEIEPFGVAPGPAAFLQSNQTQPGLFTDFKQTSSMQYYQFKISGLGTTYSAFYLYFQFYRENNSNPKKIYVEYSTNGTTFTRSLTVDLKDYNPKTWYEIYQSLTGIPQLNNSPEVYIRIYYEYQGNALVYFDNFQYSAFNQDIATGNATATNVTCPSDMTGTITINNTSPGVWEYTINGGITWQKGNVFTGLGIGTYDVRMRLPDMVSCDVVIDVALPIKSNDVTPPVISCQAAIEAATNNIANTAATLTINNPTATDGCTQPQNMLVTWTATGATSFTGTGSIGTQTFNVGTTNILFTVKDEAGNASTCTVPVTVIAKPEISCPSNIATWIANTGTCGYTGFPDVPEILAGTNVTLSWVMSGATTGSGTGIINSYTFNQGITTITWTATNKVGSVSCTQTIQVTDKEAPTFATPGPFSLCVEDLYHAIYEDSNQDIQPDRPEYYLFRPGNEVFDLNVATFKDNCCTLTTANLKWTIRTFGTGASVISGTGQPSTYTSEIRLPGDGITFYDVEHMITYTLTDCNNNSKEITVPIIIKPRPDIVKMP